VRCLEAPRSPIVLLVPLLALAACDGSAAPASSTGPGSVADPSQSGAPPTPAAEPGPCPLQLTDLALYQTVKVPLVAGGNPVANRPVDVVAGKGALVRAFASPTDPSAPPLMVHARLIATSAAGVRTVEDTRTIAAASADEDLDSTLDFDVDGTLIQSDTTFTVDVLEPATCRSKPEARLPHGGTAALAPRATGVLKVVLIPVRYDADGSGRLPDTTDAQIERLRATMAALYPVARVDISIREVVGSTVDLAGSSSSGWSQFLDSMRGLRASDHPDNDVYYYGLVEPAGTLSGYCRGACIAGISFQVTENQAALRVGVGLAFPGDTAATTLAHEVGHQHGRGHAPCGANAGLDKAYPYSDGSTSTWGFDARSGSLVRPDRRDLMGYCTPQWISDYNYQALLDRSATVNPASGSSPQASEIGTLPARDWDVLLVGADGEVRRGQPLTAFAPPIDSVRERAQLTAAGGQPMGEVDAYRLPLADVDVSMVLVPRLPPAARAIQLAKMAAPLRLDGMAAPATLRP
jgi:hypothetical protein